MTKHNVTEDSAGRIISPLPEWVFGEPVLRQANNGRVAWVKDVGTALGLYLKGPSGYLANLYGGLQTNDDWAAVYIPVNEYLIPQFNTARWSWYQTNAETMGLNIVIWVHDPDDFDKRAEITQLGGHADLARDAGWNAHEFSPSTGGMFYYGENVDSQLTAGTQYTWSQFQTDNRFSKWVIYRISLERGWEASGTFEDAWVADVELNGQNIIIQPSTRELLLTSSNVTGIAHGVKTVTSAGSDVALASSTVAKLVIVQAQTDNTDKIAVGGTGVDATVATGTGILLDPGDSVTLPCDNLADIFIDSLQSGEGVRFTYFT